MLKLAIQKSGRLSEKSLQLIEKADISFGWGSTKTRKLKTRAVNFPIELLFLRDDDIPGYVSDGVADIGIVGENEILEKNREVQIIQKLGFSKCRLSIAIPKGNNFNDLSFLNGKKIATSYPNILKTYLEKNKINADVFEISGSVEIAPSIGLANAICDLVSSGSTLLSNGLKEVKTVLSSEAALIKTHNLPKEQELILEEFLFRINSVQVGAEYKYVLLNAPEKNLEQIINILPGMRSPTVLPLAEKEWFSVHSVVEKKDFWACISQLKEAGAEGILVTSIDKMIL